MNMKTLELTNEEYMLLQTAVERLVEDFEDAFGRIEPRSALATLAEKVSKSPSSKQPKLVLIQGGK